jgi:diguanylate cyclase (GGDEF)-like protein/PAS domain S-box-containing protein
MSAPADRPRRAPRVLVVDDDATMRLLVGEALEPDGIEVEEAADGPEALARFRAQPFDLVLLDVRMPGSDGFAVCESIRKEPAGADVPIVIMTGLDDLDSIRRAYEAGATDFITKPIPWLVLSHRVRYLLRGSRSAAELRRSRERLANAQRLARMGSWHYDFESTELEVSEELRSIFGMPWLGDAPTLEDFLARVHPADRPALEEAADRCRAEGAPIHVDHRIVLPDGSERILQTQAQLSYDADGRPAGFEGTAQDVTDRRRVEEQIRWLAYHDSLTGLGNRLLFRERLDHAVAEAARTGAPLGVLFLDLDHFKRINDTFGHTQGDRLLQAVADRLVRSVRDSDLVARLEGPPAISRLGGDEFTVLLPEVADPGDLAKVARRLIEVLHRPFALGGHEVVITASVGIAAWPSDGSDAETLLRNADAAMYHAKERGRNNVQFYTASMNAVALERLILETRLRSALERAGLEVHYQPKLAPGGRRVTGVEALARWNDAELGAVPPAEFIPVAEETGLIAELGAFVLRKSCLDRVRWSERGLPDAPVAVNLSVQQFRAGGVVELVERTLAETGLDPRLLELEITESMLLRDEKVVVAALVALRERGVRVAVDDFGTGYSSLGYLRTLPVDSLKIDRSFVRDIGARDDEAALTGAIVSMGHALRLRVVAEGVEEEAQRALLEGWGCDELQGYLFARPMPADALERWWREREGSAVSGPAPPRGERRRA